jgi:hypothetical protein
VSEITVRPLDDHTFGVELREGETTTDHKVTVPPEMVDDLGLGDVDPERLVRESMAFLLEREPPTAVLREFALSDIQEYFGEYYDELATRVRA